MLVIGLVLVAVGGAALVAARSERVALFAFSAQWLGVVFACAAQDPTATNALGLGRESIVELITAIASLAVLWLTLRGQRSAALQDDAPRFTFQVSRLTDYIFPGAAVLLGGMAGVGFAFLFPLSATNTGLADLVFYWTLMASALALVLDGARSPVKLAAGLLALLNAVVLLVYTLHLTPPGAGLLGLMAAGRLGLALLLAYGWLLLTQLFGSPDLDVLFTARDGLPTELAAPQQLSAPLDIPYSALGTLDEGRRPDE